MSDYATRTVDPFGYMIVRVNVFNMLAAGSNASGTIGQ